jgi:hypothetical protein
MPASRTRKKATQKKAAQNRQREQQAQHQAFKRSLGTLLDGVPACTDCGAERVEVTQEQVPAETWEKMAPMREGMEADGAAFKQIAHCASCKQYSLLSDWGTF